VTESTCRARGFSQVVRAWHSNGLESQNRESDIFSLLFSDFASCVVESGRVAKVVDKDNL
jgi:hypothetical protein